MTYKIYKLIRDNEVVHVGLTKRKLTQRLWQHKSKAGKFTNQDIEIELLSTCTNKIEALLEERSQHNIYGLERAEDRPRPSLRSLTFKQAQEIRELYKTTKTSHRKLAAMFNTNLCTTQKILNNETYVV